jgi:hypothetical protein
MHANTPLLIENQTLITMANYYVAYLALNNLFVYSSYPKLGENIGYMQTMCEHTDLNNCSQYAYDFISKWYNTNKYYNYNKPGFLEDASHFTSLIWSSTQQIGCSLALTKDNRVYMVCYYYPQGNIIDEQLFKLNVNLPLSNNNNSKSKNEIKMIIIVIIINLYFYR